MNNKIIVFKDTNIKINKMKGLNQKEKKLSTKFPITPDTPIEYKSTTVEFAEFLPLSGPDVIEADWKERQKYRNYRFNNQGMLNLRWT